jgi:hypothetical protein
MTEKPSRQEACLCSIFSIAAPAPSHVARKLVTSLLSDERLHVRNCTGPKMVPISGAKFKGATKWWISGKAMQDGLPRGEMLEELGRFPKPQKQRRA